MKIEIAADSLRKIPPQSDFFIENRVKDFSYIIEQKKYIVGNTSEASITRRRERSEQGVLYNWL